MTIAEYVFDSEIHQNSMLQACTHGRLSELRALYQSRGTRLGDINVDTEKWFVPSHEHPISLFIAAIENNHLAILEYLLSVHPGIDLNREDIALAIIKVKQVDVLERVTQQSPEICLLEFHYTSTFLTRLCREGPCASRLVDILLDNGADVNAGGHYAFSCLGIAMDEGLPISILRKMVDAGAVSDLSMIEYAIKIERADALQLLIDRWRGQRDPWWENKILETLERCESRQIIDLTNTFVKKNGIGRGKKKQPWIIRLCERLAHIRVQIPYQSRKTEKKQACSQKIPEKVINEEESN